MRNLFYELDNAYLDEGADDVLIPTAWIPLIDANLTNGCMMASISYAPIHTEKFFFVYFVFSFSFFKRIQPSVTML